MRRRALSVIVALLVAVPAFGKVAVGQAGPSFTLKDVRDSTFSTARPRTRPLVLLFGTKDLADFSLAWGDSIRAHMRGSVIVQPVLDLGDVSRLLRPVARQRISAKRSRAVLDWDGHVSEAWRGTDRSQMVAIGVSPNNVACFIVTGQATAANVRQATQAIQAMSGGAR